MTYCESSFGLDGLTFCHFCQRGEERRVAHRQVHFAICVLEKGEEDAVTRRRAKVDRSRRDAVVAHHRLGVR